MTEQTLSVGVATNDRVIPLLLGDVAAPGLALSFERDSPSRIFWRALHSEAFDVTEMSLAAHCILASRGQNPFIGLPVFTSRMFRHGAVFVSREAPITAPEQLAGRRIGVPEYQMTAAVWMRGILAEFHGVEPRHVHWFRGGVNAPGRRERIELRLPSDYRVADIAADATLDRMLRAGEIDAVISPEIPAGFLAQGSPVQRLFRDSRAAEEDYFRRTSVFPIMHLLVLRRSVYEADPDLARILYRLFRDARDASLAELRDADAPRVMLPWLVQETERVAALMGPDFWAYGVARNQRVLDAFLRYLERQSLLQAPITVESLFANEVRDT